MLLEYGCGVKSAKFYFVFITRFYCYKVLLVVDGETFFCTQLLMKLVVDIYSMMKILNYCFSHFFPSHSNQVGIIKRENLEFSFSMKPQELHISPFLFGVVGSFYITEHNHPQWETCQNVTTQYCLNRQYRV